MNRPLVAVILATAAFLSNTADAGRRYSQNFDKFEDGTTDLRDGSTIASNNGVASVQEGALRLTQYLTGSTFSSFRLPTPGDPVRGFEVSFDFVMDSNAETPADGFAFSYGALPDDPQSFDFNGLGEEGFGVGLSVEVDTWQNAAESTGYNVAIDGVDVPGGAIRQPPPVDGIWRHARIVWTSDDDGGRVTFSIDDAVIFDDLATPGFQPGPDARFAFSARTGGVSETLLIDNLSLAPPNTREQKARRGCVAAKLGVARKFATGLFRCHGKLAKDEGDPDAPAEFDECVAVQTQRFDAVWQRVEERGACPDGLDGNAVIERVKETVANYVAWTRAAVRSPDGRKVRTSLIKLGSKHASKYYAALIRHAKRPNAELRDAKHVADRQKFDAKVERVDAKAGRADVTVDADSLGRGADSVERGGRDLAELVAFDALNGIRDGLLAYWSFNATGGTVVDHAGGPVDFSGSMNGHAHRVEGALGSAMHFDGARDYVRIASTDALNAVKGTPTMTISAWIRPEGPGSQASGGGIIINKEGEFELARFADGTIRVAVARSNNDWDWFQTIASPPTVPLNAWTHILVHIRPGGASTYVNLQINSSVSYAAAPRGDRHSDQDEIWIGDRSAQQQSFDGAIDDVAIWNRQLSAAEREALFNGGIGHPVLRTTLPPPPVEEEEEER